MYTTHSSLRQESGVALLLCLALLMVGGRAFSPDLLAQDLPHAQSMSVSGDSISRGFNADDRRCTFQDQLAHNWATGKDNGDDLCSPGPDEVFSHRERLECALGSYMEEGATVFNHARSGATMVGDFRNQATAIRQALLAAPTPRYIPVFLGHNDACTSNLEREVADCRSPNRDPNNYCRTTAEAFEREFRAGMDQLIQLPAARILISAIARISLLCDVGTKRNCILPLSCSQFWGITGLVCASLTKDCSDQRKIDMYDTTRVYNEILRRVTAEYAQIPAGGRSAGGTERAPDVLIRYLAGPFFFKFNEDHVSCCDCFHPNLNGMDLVTRGLWEGLQCSEETPCCRDTGDPLWDATCQQIDTQTHYGGGFWEE